MTEFAARMCLCDQHGMVAGEFLEGHNRRRLAAHLSRQIEEPFACSGGECLSPGVHVLCTNEHHSKPLPAPFAANVRDGLALVTVAREMRDHFAGEPSVPQSFFDDLDTVERRGRWLAFTMPVKLAPGVTLAPNVRL